MKTKNIEIVEGPSAELFTSKYLKQQIPVVLRNLDGVSKACDKWDPEYVDKVCGDVVVDVFDNGHDNSATAFTTPDLKMKFSAYFAAIREGKQSSLRVFLFNMFRHRPLLRKDFPCPAMFRGILGRMGFMFFGTKGITVRIHQDMDMSNVMLTQFHGRKKVVLVAPAYSRLLYKLPFNTHSLVNLDAPDFQEFPGLQYIETLECILEPGDTLFMPSGYWHYITYLDGGYSVSYRKIAQSPRIAVQGFLNVFVFMPIDKVCNFLFGKRWFSWKKRKANERAQKEIAKINRSPKNTAVQQVSWGA